MLLFYADNRKAKQGNGFRQFTLANQSLIASSEITQLYDETFA